MFKRLPVVFCLGAWLAITAGLGAQQAPIMSWKEYLEQFESRSIKWPYILNIRTANGELLYFGASHTSDPLHPQMSEIERLWSEFHPDVAFNEGGDPPTEKSRQEAVAKYGEPGLVRFLAARDKVPVRSIDPTRAETVAALLKRFTPEQVKLNFVLLTVAQYGRFQRQNTLEEELERVFPIFAATPGLNVPPNSISELEASFARFFPDERNFTAARESWFDPIASENFLNEMSRASSEFRDQYMVDLLTRHVKEGKKVFAVVGGTHVVMQEQAIRTILR
jgi:hypothetical protein